MFLTAKFVKGTSRFAVLALVSLVGLMFVSCNHHGSNDPVDEIVNAEKPVINIQPGNGVWDVSSLDNFDLTVAASVSDGGTVSYQWYSNTSAGNSGGNAVNGKTDASLRLEKANYAANGSKYFYLVVTNTNNNVNGTKTAIVTSDAATVTVTGNIVPTGIPITSQTDMAKIGVDSSFPLLGAYYLTRNITLSNWIPIGDSAEPFTGAFDGNDKTITLNGFDMTAGSGNTYLGIFGYVKGVSDSDKAEIKSLKINSSADAASTSASNGHAVGLVAGYAENAVIKDITLSGNFKFYSERTVFSGGAVGLISGNAAVVKGVNSSMSMVINPGSGGTAPVSGYDYVGGIVGKFINGAGIENCHNTGTVSADNMSNTTSGQIFVGGVTGGGNYAMAATYHGYITDSSSTGDVTGKCKGMWTFAGGIAGTIVGGAVNDKSATTRIERCFAAGTVSVAGTNSGNPYIGGIVGYNYYGALVSQCYFDGTVVAAKTGDYTGGIAGYNSQTAAPNNSRVEDCWSSGKVTGFNNAGGIVGQNQVNTYLRRCYSLAAVSTTNNAGSVGGIAGLHASTMTDAITVCAALNASISAPAGNTIQRISGSTGGVRSNNYALPALVPATGGAYTERKGATEPDGADIPGEYLSGGKPTQAFYIDKLGWDFSGVWKMGSDGYPKLRWQK